jgi:hypothetical protein
MTPPLATLPSSHDTLRAPLTMLARTVCADTQPRTVLSSPATPATSGAAAEVPVTLAYPPPLSVVSSPTPGAATCTLVALQFENPASKSPFVVAATEIKLPAAYPAG